jgi:serine phosphatase RsbU (regulator of sigma subunit)
MSDGRVGTEVMAGAVDDAGATLTTSATNTLIERSAQTGTPGETESPSKMHRAPSPLSLVVLLIGLVLTTVLALVCATIHDHDENRLLSLQVRQAASVVSAALPAIQIPLTSAAELAEATRGDPQRFRVAMAPYVSSKGPFVSASLWALGAGAPRPVASVGGPSLLADSPGFTLAFLDEVERAPGLSVHGFLKRDQPRLGYGVRSQVTPTTWVVYAEASLPKNRRLQVARNSAFADLNYALYLGRSTRTADLLGSSVDQLPITGRHAAVTIPFGNSAITLVGTPNGELSSGLLASLPWIVGLGGLGLSVLAALLTQHLNRRRRHAESLATQNRQLYREQRSIAQTLQHALLPQTFPEIAGVETAVRYVAGTGDVEIGGDWYDVIPIDDGHFVFVLGDVSGRGIEAATIMAKLHFAIRAYAIQGDPPAAILGKLGKLLRLENEGCFATVLCGLTDVSNHEIMLVNAGHPPPLLLNGTAAEFIRTTVFPPIGVRPSTEYHGVTIAVPSKATVVAFTDGLIERRGETIDTGLQRLRASAIRNSPNLEDLLTSMISHSAPAGSDDDTAVLAVQWKN